ncbi:MAG: hypothetical protein MJ252_11810 [archaeon]|nr:hypothetical protein [archaeon]
MSTCQYNIKVNDLSPKDKMKIPSSNFLFKIKTESDEGEIKYTERETSQFSSIVNGIQKDQRINFRLYNSDSNTLLGLADLIIPFSLICNYTTGQSFLYEKEITLSIIESTKRQLFGSILHSKPVNISVKVETQILMNKNTLKLNKSVSNTKKLTKDNVKVPLSPKILNANNKLKLDMEIEKNFNTLDINHLPKNNIVSYTEGNKTLKPLSASNPKKLSENKSGSTRNIRNRGKSNPKSIKTPTYLNNSSTHNNSANSSKLTIKKEKVKKFEKSEKKEIRNYANFKEKNRQATLEPQMDTQPKSECPILDNEEYFKTENDISESNKKMKEAEKQIENNYKKTKEGEDSQKKENNSNVNPPTEESLQENIKKNYENILNYETISNEVLNNLLKKNSNLREKLGESNELFRTELKKKQRLREIKNKFENDHLISVKYKSDDNFNMKQIVDNTKNNEMKIYQQIFNRNYFQYEINKFAEEQKIQSMSLEDKFNLLKNCVNLIIKNHQSISSFIPNISHTEYNNIKSVLSTMDIKEGEFNAYLNREEPQSKITEEDEDKEEEEEDDGLEVNEAKMENKSGKEEGKKTKSKQKEGKQKNNQNDYEEKLIENALNNSTKGQKINFVKLDNDGNFLYGTKTVYVKSEGNIIKIQTENGEKLTIEQFLQKYKKTEESKEKK